MAEPTKDRIPFTADIRRALSDVTEMLSLRQQLAEEEIRSDIASLKRLVVVGGAAAASTLAGISVVATIVGRQLDRSWELWQQVDNGYPWGSTAVACVLGGGGLLLLWSAYRRFGRQFIGLSDSIAELKEDLMWIQDFVQRDDDATA